MTNGTPATQGPAHMVALFQEDTSNLRFMKRQQWAITNYLIAILAGIFAIDKTINGLNDQWESAAPWIIGIATAIAVGLILKIQNDQKRTRGRLTKVICALFSEPERQSLGLRVDDKGFWYDWPFLAAPLLAIVAGAVIVGFAVST